MQRFINNWETPLLIAISDDDLEISVAPEVAERLVGLGSDDYYLLTLAGLDSLGKEVAWEVVKATDAGDGVITIERAQEGTAALSAAVGTLVSARLTAATLSSQAATIVTLQASVTDLTARVTALEGAGEGPSMTITVGSSGGYAVGYLPPMGAANPNSITLPAGTFILDQAQFFNDAPQRFSLIFKGKFAATLVESVNVQGCGALRRADATVAHNEQDGATWYTVFEWEVESTDWFTSVGSDRAVTFTLSP